MGKCGNRELLFIDHMSIINLTMLNNSGLHLNEYGTIPLVNNFCYNVNT